jgi:hypothetical protein
MSILKLLSEEVFEVKDQMTMAKTKLLKERLNEVPPIREARGHHTSSKDRRTSR